MSSHLSATGGAHAIDVEYTDQQLAKVEFGRFTHPVSFPHLWHPGDAVVVTSADKHNHQAIALDVSRVTSSVLIELNPSR